MLSAFGALAIIGVIVLGPLAWRVWEDRRTERALAVRARVHAALRRAFGGDSLVAVQVEVPAFGGPGRIVLSTPSDWTELLEPAWRSVVRHVPDGYELVVRPAAHVIAPDPLPLRRAA